MFNKIHLGLITLLVLIQVLLVNCGVRVLTTSERDEMLARHNFWRKLVQDGTAFYIDIQYGYNMTLLGSSDMTRLIWSDTLAQEAASYLGQCIKQADGMKIAHAKVWDRTPVEGENIYETLNKPTKPTPTEAVDAWYSEAIDKPGGMPCPKEEGVGYRLAPICMSHSHMTQVIWAKGWKVGCAYSDNCGTGGIKQEVYLCRYLPGQEDYVEGLDNYLFKFRTTNHKTLCGNQQYVGSDGLCVGDPSERSCTGATDIREDYNCQGWKLKGYCDPGHYWEFYLVEYCFKTCKCE